MIRIGVDFGGTKIEAAALDEAGRIIARERVPSPDSYPYALQAVAEVVATIEHRVGVKDAPVGVGTPGSTSLKTGCLRNANSTYLNNRPVLQDLIQAIGRPVRIANDANCFALSEAKDGAGAGAEVVFGVILGTGCGGGVVVGGDLVNGLTRIAGEWGHTPLPWAKPPEHPGPECWCGRRGCLETWISGTALGRSWRRDANGEAVVTAMRAGDSEAAAAFGAYVDRLGRGLAVICDILDPDVIVLGGGMSNVDELYGLLPAAIAPHVFSDYFATPVRKAVHGDSSGVRGAAWLWPLEKGG
jgi:fructokinase